MNLHLAMGIFALYVVAVSLVRLVADREFPRLTAMKKAWGRSRGAMLHFLSNVALPLVFGIVFMSHGIVGVGSRQPVQEFEASSWKAAVNALTVPAARFEQQPGDAVQEHDLHTFATPLWPHTAEPGVLPILPP